MKFAILYNIDYQPSVHGSSSQYYREILEQVQLIERLGYDAVWFGEHHYSGYSFGAPAVTAWRAYLAVNLDAYFYGCRAAARQFIAQGGGAIVNISTSVSFHGWPTLAAYGAAKAGVNNLTLSLSLELAHLGIRVNGVAPGPIRIEKNENFPEYLENMARQQPMGRMGLPEEVAWPVIFFASDASGFITGETILVEGGRGSRSNLLRVGSGRDEGNIVVGSEKGKRG